MLARSLACIKQILVFSFSAFSFSAAALAAPSSGSASTAVSLQHPSLHALFNCLKFRGIEHLGLQWNLMRSVVASSPPKSEAHRTSFEDVSCYPLCWLPHITSKQAAITPCAGRFGFWMLSVLVEDINFSPTSSVQKGQGLYYFAIPS